MIIRCISLVPSKIVQILAGGAAASAYPAIAPNRERVDSRGSDHHCAWDTAAPSDIPHVSRRNGRRSPCWRLFNGAPDLAERSRDIFREEFANRADADR
jgi:hypothetical protein